MIADSSLTSSNVLLNGNKSALPRRSSHSGGISHVFISALSPLILVASSWRSELKISLEQAVASNRPDVTSFGFRGDGKNACRCMRLSNPLENFRL